VVYKPRDIPSDSINNSELNPLKVLLKGGSILGLLLVLFYVLSLFLPEILTQLTPQTFDRSLGKALHKRMSVTTSSNKRLERVLRSIEGKLEEPLKDTSFFTVLDKSENAYATPGGNVYFTQAFLDAAGSDNEVLFVLGHEIGHQKFRHPTKSLYTHFLGSVLLSLIGGVDQISDLAFKATQSRFSRAQEVEADRYALNLVQQISGNTEGAFGFFERMSKKYGRLEKFSGSIFSSHPLSKERIQNLHKICLANFHKDSCVSNKRVESLSKEH